MDLRMNGHAIRRRNNYESATVTAAENQSKNIDESPPIPEYYGTEIGDTLGLEVNQLPRQDSLTRMRRNA